jgi:hypothetical protein
VCNDGDDGKGGGGGGGKEGQPGDDNLARGDVRVDNRGEAAAAEFVDSIARSAIRADTGWGQDVTLPTLVTHAQFSLVRKAL